MHVQDAATVFVRALERGAAGSRSHAAGDEGVPLRQIAEAIGKRLNLPVVSIAPEKAAEHFEFLGTFVRWDNLVSTHLTPGASGVDTRTSGTHSGLEAGTLLHRGLTKRSFTVCPQGNQKVSDIDQWSEMAQ